MRTITMIAALLLVTLLSTPSNAREPECPPDLPNPFAPGSLSHTVIATTQTAANGTMGLLSRCGHDPLALPDVTPPPIVLPACADRPETAPQCTSEWVVQHSPCPGAIYIGGAHIDCFWDPLWPLVMLHETCQRYIGLPPDCKVPGLP